MVDDRRNGYIVIGFGNTGEVMRKYMDGSIWQTAYPESMGMSENVGRGTGSELREAK